jgi:hypothetical protein
MTFAHADLVSPLSFNTVKVGYIVDDVYAGCIITGCNMTSQLTHVTCQPVVLGRTYVLRVHAHCDRTLRRPGTTACCRSKSSTRSCATASSTRCRDKHRAASRTSRRDLQRRCPTTRTLSTRTSMYACACVRVCDLSLRATQTPTPIFHVFINSSTWQTLFNTANGGCVRVRLVCMCGLS